MCLNMQAFIKPVFHKLIYKERWGFHIIAGGGGEKQTMHQIQFY